MSNRKLLTIGGIILVLLLSVFATKLVVDYQNANSQSNVHEKAIEETAVPPIIDEPQEEPEPHEEEPYEEEDPYEEEESYEEEQYEDDEEWILPTMAPTKKPIVTPKPTKRPKPTATPKPTRRPRPTKTPRPTRRPRPTEVPTSVPTVVPTAVPTEVPTEAPTPVPTEAPDYVSALKKELSKANVSNEVLPGFGGKKYDLFEYVAFDNISKNDKFELLSNFFIKTVAHSFKFDFSNVTLEAVLNSAYCTNCGKLKLTYNEENTAKMKSALENEGKKTANEVMINFLYVNTCRNAENSNERLFICCDCE